MILDNKQAIKNMSPKYRLPLLLGAVAISFHFVHHIPKMMYIKHKEKLNKKLVDKKE